MTRVQINPALLRWAVERASGKERLQERFPKLSEWLEGKSQPTLRQLEAFSRATSTPFGFLFLERPPEEELSVPFFRTLTNETVQRPSAELIEVVQTMERRQAWMREYLIKNEHDPLPFVRSASLQSEPEQIARDMRRVLKLSDNWSSSLPDWTAALRRLQDMADDSGIIVVANSVVGNNRHRPLDPNEFRGFVLVDEYAPLVFINSADIKAAQMFTLAHELAHIWLGRSSVFDLRNLQPAPDRTEIVCSQSAAEFLIPATRLQQIWRSASRSEDPFQYLARYFKVSEIVFARRLLDLELIDQQDFLSFYQSYQEYKYQISGKDEGGGNFYAIQSMRLGKRFAETVAHAVISGDLLYYEAYELTGIYGKTFDRLVDYILRKEEGQNIQEIYDQE
jgi:Zn-dependent peptidase ImmA (M78 family)